VGGGAAGTVRLGSDAFIACSLSWGIRGSVPVRRPGKHSSLIAAIGWRPTTTLCHCMWADLCGSILRRGRVYRSVLCGVLDQHVRYGPERHLDRGQATCIQA
jgi:hypothetical protein